MTLTEGLNLMNELLKRQFGLKLQRTSSKKALNNREKRENFYEMHDIFAMPNESRALDKINAFKPILTGWSVGVPQVNDEEILRCKLQDGCNVVCLGIAFDSWLCSDSEQKHRYDSIKKQCLGNAREMQKRQIQHEIEMEKQNWLMLSETEKQEEKNLELKIYDDKNRRFEISRTQWINEKDKKREAKSEKEKRRKVKSEQVLERMKTTFIGYHPSGFFGNLNLEENSE